MKTVECTPDLFDAVVEHGDYFQIGETVCGAYDPAVVELTPEFAVRYPEYAGYAVVRIIDRYVSPWKSDTMMEFSNRPMTDAERREYEELAGE